jgi:3-deoxy-7-phosphoheptulonate synthase
MIVVLQNAIQEKQKAEIIHYLETQGMKVKQIVGEKETVLGVVGEISIDARTLEVMPGVEEVIKISKPWKIASREMKKEDTVIDIGPVRIGGNRLVIIAGPCAVESREQIIETARIVRDAGAVMLRGGAFKPRTSPYAFQGLGEEGCRYLKEAGEITGLPVSTEVVSTGDVEMMTGYIDVFQIGARNMQNFELLKKVGKTHMPVILKRGLAATIEEWLMAAEYLLDSGTDKVILCERGIRTFEKFTRNTLDLSAIPVVKKLSHLPVIVDPSHATGIRDKVPPMALAAVAAGAHGIIVEVHPRPEKALSDGPQSLYPQQFEKLVNDIEALAPVLGKEIARLPERHHAAVISAKDRDLPDSDKPLVSFQGERGANSEMAIKNHFPEGSVIPLPCKDFRGMFEAVMKGRATWGMVPIENSLAGSIHENYDLLYQHPDIRIVGEIKLRIRHNLLVLKGVGLGDIKGVLSHPAALAQCREFLDKNNLPMVPFYDTAGAAAHVAQSGDRTIAAIAGPEASRIYGLEILREGIETNPQNYTRFAVIARDDAPAAENPTKASLLVSLRDEPGSLSRCLSVFSKHSLNLTKIESRPIMGKPWSYMFYMDVELPSEGDGFEKAVERIKEFSEDFRCLGLYRGC